MTVLVLNHRPLTERPVHRWLSEADALVLLTTRSALAASSKAQRAEFTHIVAIEDYRSNEVAQAMHALAVRFQPRRVVSVNEYDLIRAAVLRERLQITGQHVASALAYRDKLHMRQAAATGDIRIPRFSSADSITDVVEFADLAGFPLVLKPRRGAGSEGIVTIRNQNSLRSSAWPLSPGHESGRFLVEEFVDAPLFHVDGIACQGRVVHCWPSRYSQGNLETVTGALPLVSTLLDAEDDRREPLQDFARSVIATLPLSAVGFAFHLEAWANGARSYTLCEVTSRIGGGPIPVAYGEAFGMNLMKDAFRAQAGLQLSLRRQPKSPLAYTGWIWFMRDRGIFQPPGPPAAAPGSVDIRLLLRPGERSE